MRFLPLSLLFYSMFIRSYSARRGIDDILGAREEEDSFLYSAYVGPNRNYCLQGIMGFVGILSFLSTLALIFGLFIDFLTLPC